MKGRDNKRRKGRGVEDRGEEGEGKREGKGRGGEGEGKRERLRRLQPPQIWNSVLAPDCSAYWMLLPKCAIVSW
jgi:hypothetical protein